MKPSTLITLICVKNVIIIYAIFSFIVFDYDMSNWNIWTRAIFIVSSMWECILITKRIKDEHDN